ncbi:hypothetical protein PZT57_26775 [Pseudomonas aeruginosa]|uniref:hypothetical protein n=1 Tax=Pseudomonas aeruginosa TaxID=287 RepID=UPI002B2703B3|nr:hypothetical protein [Pseudomonas aeruginosa]MEA8592255.1 hypothetical protein [Pseudomonas aeruginosa]
MTADATRVRITEIKKESDLCSLFIRDFNAMPGWRCYPETGGFDVLAVHNDGRQIGVEAKLTLNAKVAQQILPNPRDDFNGKPGPDYRLVIVSRLTESSEGIARMLNMLGVRVIAPRLSRMSSQGEEYTFEEFHGVLEAKGSTASYGYEYMFDWNPAERCRIPPVLQDLPAGVPSPVKISPWKESAIKVVALMRRQGFVTAKQITSHGMGMTAWTQPKGMKQAWLRKGAARGQWVETEHMPPFDIQHPELYQMALKALDEEAENQFSLV